MRLRVLLTTAGFLGLAGLMTAPAQDPKAGPRPMLPANVVPSAFRAFLVTDGRFPPVKTPEGKDEADPRDQTGKIHCLVCENGLAPVVGVFVRADAKTLGSSGLAKLVKSLDALIGEYRSYKLAGFVMFLRLEGGDKTIKITAPDGKESPLTVDLEYPDDEKRDEYSQGIRDFAAAVKAPNVPLGLAPEKSKTVSAWGIGEKDEVTVVAYYRMRQIAQPWRFAKVADVTDAKIDEILRSVVEKVAVKRKKDEKPDK